MSSIFNIQQDLFDIFDQIEANEGELTPELEESLSIKKEEFNSKIESYVNGVKQLTNDIGAIKEEVDRLNTLKKSKEKLIDKLKEIMNYAILNFGNVSKSGSRFIDYGTGKVTAKDTESIVVDDNVIDAFTRRVDHYFHWLIYTNCQEDKSLDEVLSMCNDKNQAAYGEDDELYIDTSLTKDDLQYIGVDINGRVNMLELLSTPEGRNAFIALSKLGIVNFKSKVSKTDVKDNLKATGELPSYANVSIKRSVLIK